MARLTLRGRFVFDGSLNSVLLPCTVLFRYKNFVDNLCFVFDKNDGSSSVVMNWPFSGSQ